MTKQIEVDVEKSLGYQANGRLKPAKKSEQANLSIKKFLCPNCRNQEEANKDEFGGSRKCRVCGTQMIQQQ
jgi:hypothetical protein